ncbi:MAG: hypothetical protein NTW19_22560 [Planctomycetota bacterium]|nr:hypothetical protein [Planctomycetota bacterium]
MDARLLGAVSRGGGLALSGGLEVSDLLVGLGGLLAVAWAVMVLVQRNANAKRAAAARANPRRSDARIAPRDEDDEIDARESEAPRQARRADPAGQVHADLDELALEIERLSRRLNAELDHRTGRLESLLREADLKIAELRRLRGQETQADAAADLGSARDAREIVSGLPRTAAISAVAQASLGARPAPAAFAPEPASAAGEDAIARSVYALADAGHDSLEIARRLREHVGKVELILALRRS